MISTHMDHHDLRAFAVTSQAICHSLLPEYLRRRGLVMKNVRAEGLSVELRALSGYASLGLWAISPIFHPPKEIYCSIPCGTKEAQSAMAFLRCFLFQPSNTHELREFRLSLHGLNPLLLTSEFIKMQRLFYTLPLTRLSFSGYISTDCLSPSITLRNSSSYGSHTLTSLVISSDYAFAPGSIRTTMGILRHSPIKTLTIYMVSLNPSHWSTLLGELKMEFLEDIELEGDIPRSALVRFLIRHKGLKTIRISGNVLLDRLQPSRSRSQPILPNLLTLHASLLVCCDIVERANDSSSLYELQVEVSQLPPQHDPSFRHLVEMLRRFRKLDHLGLQLVPSSPSAMPEATQESLDDYDWDGHPVSALRQVRTLSCFRSQGQLSPDEIVCHRILIFLGILALAHTSDRPRCATTYDYFRC